MFSVLRLVGLAGLSLFAVSWPAAAAAQAPVNPADRAIVEERSPEPRDERPQSAVQFAPPAAPQQMVSGAAGDGDDPVIGAIRVEGVERIGRAQFASTLQPYLGRILGRDELARLAGQIADVVREAGFGLATAWIPAQSLEGGILVVHVEEGRIDALRITGSGAAAVETRLRPLVGRGPVSTSEIERRIVLAGDNYGVWLTDVRLVRENGRNILVATARLNHVRGEVSADNWGTANIGPVRARADIDVNGVIARGDQLSVGAIITPHAPDELQVVRARYAVPVGPNGTEIAVGGAVANTRTTSGTNGENHLTGTSVDAGIEVSHPLQRSRKGGLWLTARFGVFDSQLDYNGRAIYDDRIVTVGLALSGNGRMLGGRVRGRIGITTGLDMLGATRAGDPLASRYDADGTFWAMDYFASYEAALGSGFGVRIATTGQVSSEPLLSAQEFGLGGRYFVRGYDFREMNGDEGAAGSLELRYDIAAPPSFLRTAQLYAFIDGGRVFNDQRVSELASTGGGFRLATRHGLFGSLEVGVPLTPGYFGTTADPRVSFTFGQSF